MQLNAAAFNQFLGAIGQQFLWKQRSACPCVNPDSGAAKPSCPQCHGTGHIWAPGVACVAGIAGQKAQQEWARFGLYQSGDAVVTIPAASPMYSMGQFDRVTMVNSTEPVSRVMTRGAPDERFLQSVQSVTGVFWLDAYSNIVPGSIPVVNADGTLTWGATGAPAVGSQYSISAVVFTEYYCFGPLASDRADFQGASLPKKVVLRKFDLLGR